MRPRYWARNARIDLRFDECTLFGVWIGRVGRVASGWEKLWSGRSRGRGRESEQEAKWGAGSSWVLAMQEALAFTWHTELAVHSM